MVLTWRLPLLILQSACLASGLQLSSQKLPMSSLADRAIGCLIGFYCGDALAMPVHWYYDINQLHKDFGEINKYEAPKPHFPGSIMNLSNTGGGGRGSDKGEIVGSVILHGKKEFWKKGGNFHYHHGMKPGENTLDALVTKTLQQSMNRKQGIDLSDFRNAYISFMTTPGSHTDTYAGTCHRMFFKNLVDGVPPDQCADNDGHNVDSIDALMTVPTVTLAFLHKSREERFNAIKQVIQVTRKTEAVLPYAYVYSDMLEGVMKGRSIPEMAQAAGLKLKYDIAEEVRQYSNRGDPMTACYITGSFPAMLLYAYKYGDDYERLVLRSTNGGGENLARTALLGALAGARFGLAGTPSHLKDGLVLRNEILAEAETFVNIFGLTEKATGTSSDVVDSKIVSNAKP